MQLKSTRSLRRIALGGTPESIGHSSDFVFGRLRRAEGRSGLSFPMRFIHNFGQYDEARNGRPVLTEPKQRSFWKSLDVPGLLGCAALLLSIYAIFWYYSESVKGNIEPGELGIDRALEIFRSSDPQ